MKPIVVPSDSDAELCIEYRKQSKRGVRLHPDHSAFCERMWREFPVWYEEQEYRVFNETVPFGSQASRPNAEAHGRRSRTVQPLVGSSEVPK